MSCSAGHRSAGWTACILAALLACAAGAMSPLDDPAPVIRPVPASFKIVSSGEVMTGEITAWTRADLRLRLKDGGEKHVAWRDMLARQAYDIRRKLIDPKDAYEWLDLGALMLSMDATTLSEQAFAQATKLDEKTKPFVITCQAAKRRGADPQEALNGALLEAEQKDLDEDDKKKPQEPGAPKPGGKDEAPPADTGGPERGPAAPGEPDYSKGEKGIAPWPTPTPEQAAHATDAVRKSIETSFQKNGVRLRTRESDHFVLYSVLGDADGRRILGLLESTYSTLGDVLGFDPKSNIFLGKCIVFVFSERDAFIEFELDYYGNPNGKMAGGYCHPRGQSVSLCFYRSPDEQYFLTTLTHETTHAVVYRFRTPAQLPTWANEGIADFIAGQVCTNANVSSEHWQHAHAFAMQKKDPMTVVRQSYRDGTWYNEDSYPLSHMMVRYLVKRDQSAFKGWMNDIKEGKDWREAMASRFGDPVEQVMDGFSRDIRAEKSFTRVKLGAK